MARYISLSPVLKYPSMCSPVIYHDNRIITLKELLLTVEFVAKKIPEHQYLLNLYEDRYYFLIGFLVALKKQSICLFPSTVTPFVLSHLNTSYDNVIVLSEPKQLPKNKRGDKFQFFNLKETINSVDFISAMKAVSGVDLRAIIPKLERQQIVAIIFTSGSTGHPKPYIKQWGDLLLAAECLTERLFPQVNNNSLHSLLATVPAQHMYGLEMSIIVALQNGLLLHSKKPFFPQDIAQCLADLSQVAKQENKDSEPTIVTTPLHLKACLKTGINLPSVKQFISATAPLEIEMATLCEKKYQTRVMEVFGCTEVGSMASRRAVESEQWQVLRDIYLERIDASNEEQDEEIQINTARSIKQFLFNDVIELLDSQHFILKGRKEDLINIAGKRTSLSYLNYHLQSYERLSDACFFQTLFSSAIKNNRLSQISNTRSEQKIVAFVVPNELITFDEKQFKQALRNYLKPLIESVFLPKKIIIVDSLPRNSTGKLPQLELEKLFKKTSSID